MRVVCPRARRRAADRATPPHVQHRAAGPDGRDARGRLRRGAHGGRGKSRGSTMSRPPARSFSTRAAGPNPSLPMLTMFPALSMFSRCQPKVAPCRALAPSRAAAPATSRSQPLDPRRRAGRRSRSHPPGRRHWPSSRHLAVPAASPHRPQRGCSWSRRPSSCFSAPSGRRIASAAGAGEATIRSCCRRLMLLSGVGADGDVRATRSDARHDGGGHRSAAVSRSAWCCSSPCRSRFRGVAAAARGAAAAGARAAGWPRCCWCSAAGPARAA